MEFFPWWSKIVFNFFFKVFQILDPSLFSYWQLHKPPHYITSLVFSVQRKLNCGFFQHRGRSTDDIFSTESVGGYSTADNIKLISESRPHVQIFFIPLDFRQLGKLPLVYFLSRVWKNPTASVPLCYCKENMQAVS